MPQVDPSNFNALKSKLRSAAASLLRPVAFPGRYRTYRALASILGEEPVPFTVPFGNGTKLTVTAPSWSHVFYLGDLDANIRRFMTGRVNHNSIVFDVGASIGIYSVPLAKRAAHVYAFEALRANYELLLANIEQNGIRNITANFGAVAEKSGQVKAPVLSAGDCSLASDAESFVEIPALTLDDFAKTHGIDRVDIMKMDIEGSETKALQGARELFLSKAIREVVIEFAPNWLRKMGSSPEELYDLFEEYGLSVRLLTRTGSARQTTRAEILPLAESLKCLNLVLSPVVAR
jgi:FkbM family methyltransferase